MALLAGAPCSRVIRCAQPPVPAVRQAAPSSRAGLPARTYELRRSVAAFAAKGNPPDLKSAMVGSWIDLAKLVSSGNKEAGNSEFANAIGSDIYVDIGGWHLFLKDMKVATGVSIALQAKMASGKIEEPDVVDVLKKIPVKLGGGRTTLSLYDVMPARCVEDLTKLAQKAADDW